MRPTTMGFMIGRSYRHQEMKSGAAAPHRKLTGTSASYAIVNVTTVGTDSHSVIVALCSASSSAPEHSTAATGLRESKLQDKVVTRSS